MAGLAILLRKLAGDNGIEIDEEELAELGLSDDDPEAEPAHQDDVLSQPLPGKAAGQVELFLAADSTSTTPANTEGELLWYPIIREGQWAVRPGTTGKKRRVPLKVVAGHSKNQRKEIGLQDLLDAHEEEAVQHVTVPLSHNNTMPENTGFIDKMKIVDGTVKDKKTKETVKVKVLMGGYRFTEPDHKGKVLRGTYANRSAGILYDYVDTERGKTWPAVIEHVALTNKPWITGMVSFGRKLREGTADPVVPSTVSLSLSDEGPDEGEYTLALAEELELSEADQDFLAVTGATWDHETSPGWLQQQVSQILDEARAKKNQATRTAKGDSYSYVVDSLPCYRCVEAKPGEALISDGWGDNANYWVAPITVNNGVVELSDFERWTASKKAYVPDDRPAPPKNKLPLDESGEKAASEPPKTRLQLAQERRKRSAGSEPTNTIPREVVDDNMAGDTLQLSEEARALLAEQQARNEQLAQELKLSNEKIARLTGTVQSGTVNQYIDWLKSDGEDGLGLSEERGFGGVLAEIRELLLADDGEPALQSDHFAQDGGTGELSFTDGVKRIFTALSKSTEGKKRLGEMLSEPADGHENDPGKAAEGQGDNASERVPAGKPGEGEIDADKLSAEERAELVLQHSPAIAAVLGRAPVSASSSGNGKGGEA